MKKKILSLLCMTLLVSTPCFAMEEPVVTHFAETEEVQTETEMETGIEIERDYEALNDIPVYETTESDSFTEREKNWKHDYFMLAQGTYGCDYLENYDNVTKEDMDRNECGIATVILRSNLPCEPQKIFLQLTNTETKQTFGSIALREPDNRTYTYEFYLFPGTYMVDYIIAEGDTDCDFYITSDVLQVDLNSYHTKAVELKRQSTVSINGEDYFAEDIAAVVEETMTEDVTDSEQGAYDPASSIKEKETTETSATETVPQQEPELSVNVSMVIIVSILTAIAVTLGIIKLKKKK